MIRNYFKIAIRNLLKNRVFTVINVVGLSAGFAAVILIALYVRDETRYDTYDPATQNIYRIVWLSDNPQTRTPHPMAQALKADFPEVQSAVTLSPIWGAGLIRQTFSVRNLEKDIRYDERGVLAVDSTFFDVFPIRILSGNKNQVLRAPGKIMLSKTTAQKYFGDENPVGKFLAVNDDRNLAEVEGVYEDFPRQAHFHADILANYVHMKATSDPESDYYTWADFGHYNYVRLAPGASPDAVEAKLMQWSRKYIAYGEEYFTQMQAQAMGFKLQPVRDIHLHSSLRWELEPNGNIEYIYIMTGAAVLILIIASINFMNLSTAQSSARAKEIGVRRTLGAQKSQLSFQFIGESMLVATVAVMFAGLLVELTLPLFNSISGKQLPEIMLSQPLYILAIVGGGALTGALAGLYPSLVLTAVNTANILKGKFSQSKAGIGFAQVLVSFQFMMAIILLSATLIIRDQLSFMQNRDLGFSKEAMLTIPIRTREVRRDMEIIKQELMRIPGVVRMGASSNVPGSQFNQNPMYASQDVSLRVDAALMYVDYDLLPTLETRLVQGRNFSRDFPSDQESAFIINEAAAQSLHLREPIGSELVIEEDGDNNKGTVIGVVQDFHYQSLHKPVQALIVQLRPYYNTALVKISTKNIATTVAAVEQVWKKFQPGFEFDYTFLDESIAAQYQAENRMSTVFTWFAGVAILLSCLGLFGLASLHYVQRRKQVAIRKVLGAPLVSILVNLIKGYTRLIIVATVLAVPLVWMIMMLWLRNFAERITINPFIFAYTGLGVLMLAWTTIGYLTLKTVAANPVEVLKEE